MREAREYEIRERVSDLGDLKDGCPIKETQRKLTKIKIEIVTTELFSQTKYICRLHEAFILSFVSLLRPVISCPRSAMFFFYQRPEINILSFVGHMVSVTTTQLYCYSAKETIDNM